MMKPRPVVVSTNPIDGAVDVDVQTSITVNFSVLMSCGSIDKHTFRVKPVGWHPIGASSVTCSGSSATFTPSRATRGQHQVQDSVRRNGQGRQRHDVEGGLSLGFYHCAELPASGHRDADRDCHSDCGIYCDRNCDDDRFGDSDRHSDGDCQRDADRYAYANVNFNCN